MVRHYIFISSVNFSKKQFGLIQGLVMYNTPDIGMQIMLDDIQW